PAACALLLLATPRSPNSPLSPYTTLFRSEDRQHPDAEAQGRDQRRRGEHRGADLEGAQVRHVEPQRAHLRFLDRAEQHVQREPRDRKSTRLNSSHVKISYAVFCLKKKKKK